MVDSVTSTVCAGAIRGDAVSRGNHDRKTTYAASAHSAARKAHVTIIANPPGLTRNQIQSLKKAKPKQWLKFAKQTGKVGGIGLGIFLNWEIPPRLVI